MKCGWRYISCSRIIYSFHSRIDAEGVIDRMLAETRWATKSETSASEEGLALYVDRDGAASIDPQGAGFQKVTLADTSS